MYQCMGGQQIPTLFRFDNTQKGVEERRHMNRGLTVLSHNHHLRHILQMWDGVEARVRLIVAMILEFNINVRTHIWEGRLGRL